MLQIIISSSERYSIGEMAQMAVEAGATWLVLSLPDTDNGSLRDLCADVVELCRESGVMLSIEDNVEAARELSLHGVFLAKNDASPVKVREELGAEAIIGAVVGTPDAALSLERGDIDYVALTKSDPALIMAVRNAGGKIPVVAYMPDFEPTPENIALIKADGFSGLCAGRKFFEQEDPVTAISDTISILTSL